MTQEPAEQLVEQANASVAVTFPARFQINVFSPPSQAATTREDPEKGVALLLVYDDQNGDGRRTLTGNPEPILGGALDWVLFWHNRPLTGIESLNELFFPVGYSIAPLPLNCRRAAFSVSSLECGQQPLALTDEHERGCRAVDDLAILEEHRSFDR